MLEQVNALTTLILFQVGVLKKHCAQDILTITIVIVMSFVCNTVAKSGILMLILMFLLFEFLCIVCIYYFPIFSNFVNWYVLFMGIAI